MLNLTSTETQMLTVDTINQVHPGIRPKTLRKWIFKSRDREVRIGKEIVVVKGNGLDKAIVRVGRSVFIDNARFIEWMREQNERGER